MPFSLLILFLFSFSEYGESALLADSTTQSICGDDDDYDEEDPWIRSEKEKVLFEEIFPSASTITKKTNTNQVRPRSLDLNAKADLNAKTDLNAKADLDARLYILSVGQRFLASYARFLGIAFGKMRDWRLQVLPALRRGHLGKA